jgi:hypothetical protein
LEFNICKSLRAAGADASSYYITPHPFGYAETSTHTTIDGLRRVISSSPTDSLIILTHGEIWLLNELESVIGNRTICVGYTGSAYRRAPEAHNAVFNPRVKFTLTDECEFMQLGAKNIHYFAAPFEMNGTPKFGHEIHAPYAIGHFPSNPEVKGTEKILEMLGKVKQPFTLMHSNDRVSHTEQLTRMNNYDIYIELFKPELNGKPYGCWGVTAFEAAAAGKIVVTQNINLDVYESAYGSPRKGTHPTERICPFFVCNTEQRFIDNVSHLLELSPAEISRHQTDTYNWVTEKHSFEATGKYLLSIFGRYWR